MNFITPRRAVSLFPKATFISKNSYICRARDRRPSAEEWQNKYRERGYQLIKEVQSINIRDIHVGARSANDRYSWTMSVAGERIQFSLHSVLNLLNSDKHSNLYIRPSRRIQMTYKAIPLRLHWFRTVLTDTFGDGSLRFSMEEAYEYPQ
jgi:hypothetical protein